MKRLNLSWEIEEEHEGMLLRDYLYVVRGFSRRTIKHIKENGELIVNGREETVRYKLCQGDDLVIVFPEEHPAGNLQAEEMPLTIVYEDDLLLVLDKPAGVAVMPSMNHDVTIANGLVAYYQEKGLAATVHIVTRLDRDTSGLMLIAKHQYSHSLLARSKVQRTYGALVEGQLPTETGVIDAPISRKAGSIIEREVHADGKNAVTEYRVIEKFADHSFVELKLQTGRTHQIRVHMAHEGCPLAGDDLYGGSRELVGRQALHCMRLHVKHPLTGQALEFTSTFPADILHKVKR
ncbi:RluA family pseudouridine synthase [Thalassobacillus pellis]|uniref:RluA family pseudouridine synthase n=1 Tax=Thalassobacillus pellis TaxID=748008 RepID=UPI00195FE038|nr:RluA family pseudouridine synthase [Thalassobacillus pellis]MBM7554014.1 23S rRNA pseudouridine1911/1915/1917 synthase [Thalassobacillus pellis]